MTKYDLNLLNAEQFQYLGCDLICERENFEIESFSLYKDKGIDGLFRNKKNKIVIQCKKRKDFNSLKNELKKIELDKIKDLNPSRYILVVSTEITLDQKEELKNILKNHVKNDGDIITGDDIKKYFRNKKYEQIKNEYLSYLNPSYDEYRKLIRDSLNSSTITATNWLIDDIEETKNFFISTKPFRKAIKALENNNVILLTGTPGSGKTTNATMIVDYLYTKKKIKEFYKVNSCHEILNLIDESIPQAFFIDDFWGSTFILQKFDINEERNLIQLIDRINNHYPNTYLILTSREYVLQQGMNSFKTFKNVISEKKIFFNNHEYSQSEKAKILLEHAKHSNLNLDYILAINSYSNRIISMPNYSPRLVNSFIKNNSNYNGKPSEFIDEFMNYIRSPKDYFDDFFYKLSEGAKMLAFILSVSPYYDFKLDYLKESFICIVKNLNSNEIKASEFNSYFHELENSFLEISLRYGTVQFLNKSINDYILETLKIKIVDFLDVWIKYLPYFNQIYSFILDDAFTIDNKEKDLLINRIIDEFDNFKVLEDYEYDFLEDKSLYQGTALWRCIKIAIKFKSEKLLNFIKSKVEYLIDSYEIFHPHYEDENFPMIPELVNLLEENGLYFDKDLVISKYLKRCNYLFFLLNIEYFPSDYKKAIKKILKNKMDENQFINWLIYDLEELRSEGITYQYEITLSELPKILKLFDLKMTTEIRNIVNEYKFIPKMENNKKLEQKYKINIEEIRLNNLFHKTFEDMHNFNETDEDNIIKIINKTNLPQKKKELLIDSFNIPNSIFNRVDYIKKSYIHFIISFIKDTPKVNSLDWSCYPKIEKYLISKFENKEDISFLYSYAYYLKINDDNFMSYNNLLKEYKIDTLLIDKLMQLGVLIKNYNIVYFSDYKFQSYLTIMYMKNSNKLSSSPNNNYYYELPFVEPYDMEMFDMFDSINFKKYYLIPAFEEVKNDLAYNKENFTNKICNITFDGNNKSSTSNYSYNYFVISDFFFEYLNIDIGEDIIDLFLEDNKSKKKKINILEYMKKNKNSITYNKIMNFCNELEIYILEIYNSLKNNKQDTSINQIIENLKIKC